MPCLHRRILHLATLLRNPPATDPRSPRDHVAKELYALLGERRSVLAGLTYYAHDPEHRALLFRAQEAIADHELTSDWRWLHADIIPESDPNHVSAHTSNPT